MLPMLSNFSTAITRLNWRDTRDFLRFMVRRFDLPRLQQVAGNLTFVTLISLVPLLAIALAVFTQFPIFGSLRHSLDAYFTQAMFPKQFSSTILGYLTRFASKAAHMSIFGVIGLFISALAMVSIIEHTFNQVWRIRLRRSLPRRLAIYVIVAVLGPFVFGISLSLTTYLYIAAGGAIKNPTYAHSALLALLSVAWSTLAFTLLYVVVPNRTVHWREAIIGGLFAAISFEVAKRLFALLLVRFPTYSVIYGALAAVPIFLLWIYLSWLITLMGAALTAAIHFVWYGRWRVVRRTGGAFSDAVDILRLLYEARLTGNPGVAEAVLRERTGFGLSEIELLLWLMQTAGWVEMRKPDARDRIKERTIRADSSAQWQLVANPDELTLATVYRLFVFDPSAGTPLSIKVDAAIAGGLGDSLAAYFSRAKNEKEPVLI